MNIMNKLKEAGNKVSNSINAKSTAAVVATSALLASNAHAGPIAEAVKTATADIKADLVESGGVALGISLVTVGFVAVVYLFRRAT